MVRVSIYGQEFVEPRKEGFIAMLRAFFFTHIYTDTDICIGRCTVSTLYTLYDELRTLIIINYILQLFALLRVYMYILGNFDTQHRSSRFFPFWAHRTSSPTTMLSRTVPRAVRTLRPLAVRAASTSTSVPTQKPSAEATHPAGPSQPAPAVIPQSPNYPKTWSTSQRAREDAYKESRFEQTSLEFQPNPVSAMELISKEPVRLVHGRKAVCDGGV